MGASNFSERELAGACEKYARAVNDIKDRYGFDFVSIGLTAFIGAPLKWIYSAGATGERHRRIVLDLAFWHLCHYKSNTEQYIHDVFFELSLLGNDCTYFLNFPTFLKDIFQQIL